MSETNLTSKTIWGFALAFLIGGLQSTGLVGSENFIAELIQYISTVIGLWGARNALR